MASQKEGIAAGADKVTANTMFVQKGVLQGQPSPVTVVFLFPLQLPQQLFETLGGPRP